MRRAVWMGYWVGLLSLIACGDVEANQTALRCGPTSACPDQLVCYRDFCIESAELPGDLDDAGLNSEATAPVDDAGSTDATPVMTGASSPAPMSSAVDASQPAQPAPSTPAPPTPVVDSGVRPAPVDGGAAAPTPPPATPAQPRAEDLLKCLGQCTIGNLLTALRLESDACQRCLDRARCEREGDGDDNARRCRNER